MTGRNGFSCIFATKIHDDRALSPLALLGSAPRGPAHGPMAWGGAPDSQCTVESAASLLGLPHHGLLSSTASPPRLLSNDPLHPASLATRL